MLDKSTHWGNLKACYYLVSLDRAFVFQDTSVNKFVSMKLKHFVMD